MFHNIPRDYDKPLKQQIDEGKARGWEYIGVFGCGPGAIVKFIEYSR